MADDIGKALRDVIRGDVDFSTTARALHTMDASNYRRVPRGVVAPKDADDVRATLALCAERGVPVVGRGGGTSIAGQATGTGVVVDFTRHMNRVLDIDPATRTARVQPGVILDRLQTAAAPLRFGPDPSTHSRCTLGGMIGNNSCGSHSVAWGTTADSVAALDVAAADGTAYRLGQGWSGAPAGLQALVEGELAAIRTGFAPYAGLPRRISGYALDALLPENGTDLARFFCGTEGTLGLVTEATVRLVEAPPAKALAVLAYADESAAAEAAAGLLPYGPLTVEGMAADLVPPGSGLPKGGAWLFVETGGATPAEARAAAERIVRAADVVAALVVDDPAGQRTLWRIREDASGTATRMPDGSEAWPGWEDCAVPPARLGTYLREFRGLLREHGLRGTPYGHFGDGCIHVRIDFDLLTEPGIARFRRFSEELAGLVVAHGGSLSGEHGDGQARAELLPRMYGDGLVGLFERVKGVWDPADVLNPGMLVRPARLDENLRFAVLPRKPVDVEFGYPHDGGDFGAAVRRCVGVAKCRTQTAGPGGGVMCPSFRATGGDETHSTRGRARLLHEMLAGEVVTDGWRSTEVRDALDLCLSCKGCRSDCPVGVDMATYKAEFLHHHYEGRRRPMAHYTMGWLPRWLALVERTRTAPVVNALARVGVVAGLGKRLGGIAPERRIPRIARRTFSTWWRRDFRRRSRGWPERFEGVREGAILWPDTFTEHLAPEVGQAAVRVLEAAGVMALMPPRTRFELTYGPDGVEGVAGGRFVLDPRRPRVCCGLTYVSTGQLDRARTVLRRTLDLVPSFGDDDLPIIVLEPSCAAALRSDLPELLPDDPRAQRLADRVLTFAEALERLAPDWIPPRVDRPVVGQTHCHQHAILGDAADRRLRERMGLDGELSGGCCGLAGNFGFEKGHGEVSAACAEEQLLPAVRAARDGSVTLADGFSCRTQLEQLGGVRARHLAEVLAQALDDTGAPCGPSGPSGSSGSSGG
ncbi:FAD-binding and (Fe-S)-binding domain-containing protein [Streptomyces sp. Q6]|uniref:FAD-binding and (Fe-S)-binding domain-containing protein n=1 Tax=Streptomyces citrinus TaxID=3118173 RepID=A0ACD5ADM2_9ACTN